MFDFSGMDKAFTAMGELDGLLRSILAEQRTTNMLLAMSIVNERTGMLSAENVADLLRESHEVATGPDART